MDNLNQYAYDGEGRLCAVQTGGNGGPVTGYLYDASGTRVVKGSMSSFSCPSSAASFSTVTAEYLLGQGGEQVTELNGSGVWQHTNIWAGSKLDATYDSLGLHFHLSDPLGSRRVQIAGGATGVENRFQSLPFGDGLMPPRLEYRRRLDRTPLHRQRTRCRIRKRLLRGQVLLKFNGKVHESGSNYCHTGTCCKSATTESLRLCCEQSAEAHRLNRDDH